MACPSLPSGIPYGISGDTKKRACGKMEEMEQKGEVRSQKAELRRWKTEDRSSFAKASKDKGRKTNIEHRMLKWPKDGTQNAERRTQKAEDGSLKLKV